MADPVIRDSLVEAPDKTGYYLSGDAVSTFAKNYLLSGLDDNATIVNNQPALTVKLCAPGPNGRQEFQVSVEDFCYHMPQSMGLK